MLPKGTVVKKAMLALHVTSVNKKADTKTLAVILASRSGTR